jgi:hypothetical protein
MTLQEIRDMGREEGRKIGRLDLQRKAPSDELKSVDFAAYIRDDTPLLREYNSRQDVPPGVAARAFEMSTMKDPQKAWDVYAAGVETGAREALREYRRSK